jgi:guanosine-3',5'-bis(diphosphate) 3'-pyrophosphohydrolase
MKYNDALNFASDLHDQAQCSYGGKEYRFHLTAVGEVARTFDFLLEPQDREDVYVATALHDTLEDTELEESELLELFGKKIFGIVMLVTDKPGANRKERHQNTYPALAEHNLAVYVKLCDRIANMEDALATLNLSKINMYKKEHPYFKETLAKNTLTIYEELWSHVDWLMTS